MKATNDCNGRRPPKGLVSNLVGPREVPLAEWDHSTSGSMTKVVLRPTTTRKKSNLGSVRTLINDSFDSRGVGLCSKNMVATVQDTTSMLI